jgi:effector-binding domain-containing protein
MDGIEPVYESLIAWVEDSGYRLTGYSRELYLEMTTTGPSVTELQVPIAR